MGVVSQGAPRIPRKFLKKNKTPGFSSKATFSKVKCRKYSNASRVQLAIYYGDSDNNSPRYFRHAQAPQYLGTSDPKEHIELYHD